MVNEGPIFLVGWFRSGTTMFWNMFRESGQYTCYYEPLHEHLRLYVDQGHYVVDPTHDGVKDYWREYQDIPRAKFRSKWQPWFGRQRWVLDDAAVADDLKDYLDLLISHADRRPVLKFVRAGLRGEWLRANYPDARIIHIVRNPRAVWTSMMGRDCRGDGWDACRSDSAESWLRAVMKFSSELGIAGQAHPYQQFFLLWSMMFHGLEKVANDTWWYEDAVAGGDQWVARHLVEPGYLSRGHSIALSARSLHPAIHDESWYWQKEVEAVAAAGALKPLSYAHDKQWADCQERIRRLEDRYENLYLIHKNQSRDHLVLLQDRAEASGWRLLSFGLKVLKMAVKYVLRFGAWRG